MRQLRIRSEQGRDPFFFPLLFSFHIGVCDDALSRLSVLVFETSWTAENRQKHTNRTQTMGAGASSMTKAELDAELAKPVDASDIETLEQAQNEIKRIRDLLKAGLDMVEQTQEAEQQALEAAVAAASEAEAAPAEAEAAPAEAEAAPAEAEAAPAEAEAAQ